MVGIPIEGPSYVYCNNNYVVINRSNPASTLKKKSNYIAFHCVRESVALDEQRVTYKSTHSNLADILTKPLPGGVHRDYLIGQVLQDIITATAIPFQRRIPLWGSVPQNPAFTHTQTLLMHSLHLRV
jgi:hypothetical protein